MNLRSTALTALLLVALAPTVSATPATGFPTNPECTNTTDMIDSHQAELYVLKVPASGSARQNDWLWNTDRKLEASSDSQALLSGAGWWSTGDVWAEPQVSADVAFSYITFAGGFLYADSSDGSVVDWGATPVQKIGDSLPIGRDAGIGLVLPETAGRYDVTLAPGIVRTFPMATTSGALIFAFSPIAEVNPMDTGGGCQIGGETTNPQDPTRGAIIGYNVYRLPSCGCTPTREDFHRAALTDDDFDGGWIYFIDLRKFDLTLSDTTPGIPGLPSPLDLDPDDLAGIQNPDGWPYTGDEVVLFSDMDNISRPRNGELAPVRSLSYWYALQPVVHGSIDDFAATGFTVNDTFQGDHRMDLDNDGEFDAVSLNTVAPFHDSAEFFSPQAEPGNGGQDGLGLTHHGVALLSACFFVDLTLPLPATGQVQLTGVADGMDVALRLTTGLEPADILGYNVFRVVGANRVRVNEKPILAQGGESNSYLLVDLGVRSRSPRPLEYVVEFLPADSSPSRFSEPFLVSGPQPERRRR